MAKIVTIKNPLTGQPAQVDKLDHTAQQIDDGLNIARGVSNPNLLDNGYFANPVDQRNVSGAIDAVGYFLDRWKLVSGSVTIGSNGITLNGTIAQILETAVGTDVTASALTTEGVVVASYDNNSKTFSLTGTGQTFVAAKLELGSQQTLAHQDADGNWVLNEIPDYADTLARCQRYFFSSANSNSGKTSSGTIVTNFYNQSIAFCNARFPIKMRAIPSVKIFSTRGTEGKVTDWASGTDSINVAVHGDTLDEFGFNCIVTSDAFITNGFYTFNFEASADL